MLALTVRQIQDPVVILHIADQGNSIRNVDHLIQTTNVDDRSPIERVGKTVVGVYDARSNV